VLLVPASRGDVRRYFWSPSRLGGASLCIMADNNNNDDEDTHSKRDSHFNQQRSSLRSDSSVPTTRSRPESGQRLYDIRRAERAGSDTIPSASSPSPVVPFTRSRASSNAKGKGIARLYPSSRNLSRRKSGPSADDARKLEELNAPESWANPYALLAQPSPIPLHEFNKEHERAPQKRTAQRNSSRLSYLARAESQLDITALPSMTSITASKMDPHARSKPTPTAQRTSRIATELYTISYLIFFAIWGSLARLGLQALTFYPGAPVVFSELWANVAGTVIIGFLSEDRSLFAAEWGSNSGDNLPEPADRPADDRGAEKKRHGKVKKTIPLYIGLATGFCGSFTSFSSFIRDIFLSLSNDLKAPIYHPGATSMTVTQPRNDGYSVMAVLATILTTISLCYCALKVGAHFALLIQPITPTLPFRLMRRIIDPLFVFLGWGCWLAAILLSIFPPHDAWRSQALFALVFAPLGCLARHYISLFLNPVLESFPLGTFSVNIFGTAVLGMSYDLQRVPLRYTGVVGGSMVGCQVLQGIEDGFCGALTTVSTWMTELDTLGRRRAYGYGIASVGGGLGLLVVIMGSVRWTVGWEEIICRT
jgi:CrcB protein